MFVLFLSFVFSNVIVKCQTNDTMFKNNLQKSLVHVNAMLADIEGKIQKERKKLVQMDYDLSYKDKAGLLDYEVTDIWWPTIRTRTTPQTTPTTPEGAKKTTRSMLTTQIKLRQQNNRNVFSKTNPLLRVDPKPPAISDIVSAWVRINTKSTIRTSDTTETLTNAPVQTNVTTNLNISTTLTINVTTSQETQPIQNTTSESELTVAPTPAIETQALFPPGVPTDAPFVSSTVSVALTQDSSFVQNLTKDMVQDQHGYCSAFVTKFLEIVTTKEDGNLTPVLQAIELALGQMIADGKLQSLGQDITNSIYLLMAMRGLATLTILRRKASVVHQALKHRSVLIPQNINSLINTYDEMFTQEEGDELFASLDRFDQFPEDKTALEVAQRMLTALFAPYLRVSGTKEQRKFLSDIHHVLQELFPHWRANDETVNTTISRIYSNIFKLSNSSKDKNRSSLIPARRRMELPSYKKIMRHLIMKHPKLFKKYYRHYKHNKESTHHHTSHNKHRHVPYKNLTKKISPQTVVRAYVPMSRKTIAPTSRHTRTYLDSYGSGAYYHERYQKDKRNIEKRKDKKPLYNRSIIPSKLNSINAEYVRKQIAKHLKTKSLRRFMTESLENEKVKHSQNLQNSVDNNGVHKIRESSSYSDEEDSLRSNLYDALRHGNETFVEFRALDTNTIYNQTIGLTRDSSSDPDYELILKNNIYKVFEQ